MPLVRRILSSRPSPAMVNVFSGANQVSCQLVLLTPDARVIGSRVDSTIASGGSFVAVAMSAGTDVEAGTYGVRVQYSSPNAAVQFHRGNLTVAIASR
ncbi:hypothetical protein BH20ACT16_BH20ACT16_06260 [soil metagenome]|jgi:hypothetical protein